MGCPRLRPGGPVSRRTTSQERYPFGHVPVINLDPPAIDGALRTPVRKPMLGRHRNQLVYPLTERCVIADERKQPSAHRQIYRQRLWMSQPLSPGDRRVAL